MVGPANGRAVLDIMRPARTLPELGLDPCGVAGVYGYSEGGNAAGWAAQLQPGYAPDVALAGVAVGGAPVLIGHGRQDQVQPYRQSELLLRRRRALGADATHHRIAWGEHLSAAPQFARSGFAFLGGRFAARERAGGAVGASAG